MAEIKRVSCSKNVRMTSLLHGMLIKAASLIGVSTEEYKWRAMLNHKKNTPSVTGSETSDGYQTTPIRVLMPIELADLEADTIRWVLKTAAERTIRATPKPLKIDPREAQMQYEVIEVE